MDISMFLAKVLGLFFIVMSVGLLTNLDRFKAAVKQIMGSEALLLILGLVTLIVGSLLVVAHGAFVADKTAVITVVAWLVFIGGIVRVVFPQWTIKMMAYCDHSCCYRTAAVITLLLGLYLAALGFHCLA